MKLLTRIFLASLIIVKIVLGSVFIYQVELDPLLLERSAIASEGEQKDPEGTEKPARHLPAIAKAQAKQAGREASAEADRPARHNSGGEDETIVRKEEIDLNFLIKKRAELKEEEEELAKKRVELMAIQEEINNKIVILTQLRNEIRAEMTRKKTVEEKRLKHLIKAYSAMKPQKAASLIEKLDIGFAVELLSKMKGEIVGNILSFVNIEKAAKISEKLAKRQ